jgi:formate dehydrogenase subunit gamma
LIAAGVLPGYKGVWRSMHLGGRLKKETAERVWPAWIEIPVHEETEPPSQPDAPQTSSSSETAKKAS